MRRQLITGFRLLITTLQTSAGSSQAAHLKLRPGYPAVPAATPNRAGGSSSRLQRPRTDERVSFHGSIANFERCLLVSQKGQGHHGEVILKCPQDPSPSCSGHDPTGRTLSPSRWGPSPQKILPPSHVAHAEFALCPSYFSTRPSMIPLTGIAKSGSNYAKKLKCSANHTTTRRALVL